MAAIVEWLQSRAASVQSYTMTESEQKRSRAAAPTATVGGTGIMVQRGSQSKICCQDYFLVRYFNPRSCCQSNSVVLRQRERNYRLNLFSPVQRTRKMWSTFPSSWSTSKNLRTGDRGEAYWDTDGPCCCVETERLWWRLHSDEDYSCCLGY